MQIYKNDVLNAIHLFSICYNEFKMYNGKYSSTGFEYDEDDMINLPKFRSIDDYMARILMCQFPFSIPAMDYLYVCFAKEFGELPDDTDEADKKCKEIINEHFELAPFINYYRYPFSVKMDEYRSMINEDDEFVREKNDRYERHI